MDSRRIVEAAGKTNAFDGTRIQEAEGYALARAGWSAVQTTYKKDIIIFLGYMSFEFCHEANRSIDRCYRNKILSTYMIWI
jgi:hypothetical protein